MKLGAWLALTVPELRRMSGGQLLKVWTGCTPYSRNAIYLHIVLLMACASVIFNTAMRVSDSFFVDLIGLAIGLTLPPNIYFQQIFKRRRQELRQFIEANWEEFRPE
jgi:ABC-type uncharacterized transport system YnjBCD permease subunit